MKTQIGSAAASVALVLTLFSMSPASGSQPATAWDASDVRVNDPSTQFEGPDKNIREPTIAIDPTDPMNMVAFAIDLSTLNYNPDQYGTNREFHSSDGGATWIDKGPVHYTSDPDVVAYSGDPVAVFAPNGDAYLASLSSIPTGDGEYVDGGIYVHRSVDGGQSWALPVLAVADQHNLDADTCDSTDKEWLSIDPATGRLYLAYTLFIFDKCSSYGDPVDLAYYSGLADIGVFLTTSDDHGQSWSTPQRLWSGYALGATPRVTPDGTLLVAFWSAVQLPEGACPTAIGAVPARAGGGPFAALIVARSTDGGHTWTYHREAACGVEPELLKPGAFVGGTIVPAMSIDASTGMTFVVWPSYQLAQQRFTVALITSVDDGVTWSEPVDLTPGTDHALMPTVHADAGVARVAYLTTSPDPTGRLLGDSTGRGNTYVVESAGGAGWSAPFSVSSVVGDYASIADVGDYIGIDVAAGRVAVLWTDARNAYPTEIWARAGSVPET